jgi:hypothetical protein
VLPGYGPGRVILDAAFSDQFHAWGALAISVVWALGLAIAVLLVLGRLVAIERDVAPRRPDRHSVVID